MLSIMETSSFAENLTVYREKNTIILMTYFVVLLEDKRWNSKKKICFWKGANASLKQQKNIKSPTPKHNNKKQLRWHMLYYALHQMKTFVIIRFWRY